MQIEGGGLPDGSLSGYMSGRLSRQDQQVGVDSRLTVPAALANQGQVEGFLQRTSLLREHLLQLATPLDELLDHFHTWQLLHEVSGYSAFKDDHIRPVAIIPEQPAIYREVVTRPRDVYLSYPFLDPKTGQERYFNLEELNDPNTLSVVIPRLDGYGFSLANSFVSGWESIPIYEERQIARSFSSTSGFGGEMNTSSSHVDLIREVEVGKQSWPIRATRTMSVTVGFSGPTDVHPDHLVYKLQEGRELGSGIVRRDDPEDALKVLIGDNLIALEAVGKISLRKV